MNSFNKYNTQGLNAILSSMHRQITLEISALFHCICTFTKESFRICPIHLSKLTVSSSSILLCIHHKTNTNVYITELNAMRKVWIFYSAMCITFYIFVSV